MCCTLKVSGERRLKLDSEELPKFVCLFIYLEIGSPCVALPSLEFAVLKGLALNIQRFASSLSWDSRCVLPRLARQILSFTY